MLLQTTAKERIASIDALRGFALFGIILANVPFSREAAVVGEWNSVLDFFYNQFIAHKFMAVFSMLFGFGFYIQFNRFQKRAAGSSFNQYFIVRMLLLFLIGCLHAYLVWFGDILRAYALGGILLLMVRKWPVRRLLWLAAFFAVLLAGIMFILIDGFGWQTYSYPESFYDKHPMTESYLRYLYINYRIDPWVNFVSNMPLPIFYAFGNMLIGFSLGKMGFFTDAKVRKKWSRYLIPLGLFIGLPLNFIFYLVMSGSITLDISLAWLPFVLSAGLLLQALFYIAVFTRLYQMRAWGKLLSVFNPIGRMALTNYILQSVFYLTVIYHCLNPNGLYGTISRAQTYGVVLLFFLLQTGISVLWLKHFKQGPLERLWKRLAYRMANR